MKKMLIGLFLFTFFVGSIVAQPVRTHPAGTWTGDTSPMLNSMNAASTDTNYWQYFGWGPSAGHTAGNDSLGGHYEVNINAFQDSGYVNVSYSTDVKAEGTGSMKLDVSVHGTEGWGGYSKIQHMHPDTAKGFYDWSQYDTVSFQYYMPTAPSHPGVIELRFNVLEYSNISNPTYVPADGDGGKPLGEFYYSFTGPRLGSDAASDAQDPSKGWVTVDIPLVNDPNNWNNATGFNRTGWAGISGNETFDTDRIKGYTFEFSGNATDSSVATATVYIDNLTLKGRKTIPLVLFNGQSTPGDVTLNGGCCGGGSLGVAEGAGATAGTNALKGVLPSNTYDYLAFLLTAPRDLSYEWAKDSLKFKIKADAGIGDFKLSLYDNDTDGWATGTDHEFHATYDLTETAVGYDGTWKSVAVPLTAFNRSEIGGWDGAANAWTSGTMDSTKVAGFQLRLTSNSKTGATIHLDDVWVGSPVFDWVPPAAPANVSAIPGKYMNAVVWDDVPAEFGEVYNVYATRMTTLGTSPNGTDLVAANVAEDIQTVNHHITTALADRNTYYVYSVQAVDANGNLGPLGTAASAVGNNARGIPTMSLTAPTSFKADGDLSEWSGIVPLELGVSKNSMGTPKVIGTVDDDDDAYVKLYLAADDTTLYIAADVKDNNFHVGAGNWWEQDAMEVFMGLYDQRGAKHGGAKRGAEPDYKFAFLGDSAFVEFGTSTGLSGKSYVQYHNSGVNGSPDAVIEFSIRLDSLAKINTDSVFVAKAGMRIPIEPVWHDNDGSGWEGNIVMSATNNDNAWQTPSVWSHTYVGNKDGSFLGVDDELLATRFSLKENYPNPFNPTTTIEYTIGLAGPTTLMVYDVLGREIVKLVDEYRPIGTHKVVWNAANIPSGIYFYQIESSGFIKTHKMVLMK